MSSRLTQGLTLPEPSGFPAAERRLLKAFDDVRVSYGWIDGPFCRIHLARTNLGILHLRRGEHEEAARQLKLALHVYPGYDRARELLERIPSVSDSRTKVAPDAPAAAYVFNDLLEIFGEVSTVAFDNE